VNATDEFAPGLTYGGEYNRQLDLRQDGLNDLTVGEWKHNLAEFNKPVADGGGRIGAPEQAQARLDAGGTTDDGTAILHGPDQVAGGRPDTFDGLGHSGTNSSIGSQWKSRIVGLQLDVRAITRGMDPDLLRFVHLNTRLVP